MRKKYTATEATKLKMSLIRKGVPKSDEHKRKLSESNIGKHRATQTQKERLSLWAKANVGDKHYLFGKTHKPESIEKMRVAKLGKKQSPESNIKRSISMKGKPKSEQHRLMHIGEKNAAWKGGISYKPYCPRFTEEFKTRVRSFFGCRCVECDVKQDTIRLDVHHVNFNKQTCCDESDRLFVPLCHSCHSKTRWKFDYYKERYTKLIKDRYNGKCFFTEEEMTEFRHYQSSSARLLLSLQESSG